MATLTPSGVGQLASRTEARDDLHVGELESSILNSDIIQLPCTQRLTSALGLDLSDELTV